MLTVLGDTLSHTSLYIPAKRRFHLPLWKPGSKSLTSHATGMKYPWVGVDNVAQLKRAVQAVVKPRLDDYLVADIIIKARRRGDRSERDDDDAVEFNARTTLSLVLSGLRIEAEPTVVQAFPENVELIVLVPPPAGK